MIWKYKRKLAGFLAASMAAAVLVPAQPVQAAATVKLTFDTGYGPRLNDSDGELWGALVTGSSDEADNETPEYRTEYIFGDAGKLYETDNRFLRYKNNPDEMSAYGATYQRPILAKWENELLPEWKGYIFKGWYTDRVLGDKVEKLTPSFPYQDTTYYARWEVDPNTTQKYPYTVVHKATTQNGVTFNFFAEDSDGNGTTKSLAPESAVSASRKNIPGYTDSPSFSYSPERSRRYNDEEGVRKGFPIMLDSSSDAMFLGTMPNENLKVTYTYQVDTTKTFPLTIRYVDQNGNPLPGVREQKVRKSAEAELTIIPADVAGYKAVGASIEAGNTSDLKGRGIYGVEDIGYQWVGDNSCEFRGYMPNQALTIKYTYDVDPDYMREVKVNYIDSAGRNLHAEGILNESQYPTSIPLTSVNPQPSMDILVPDLTAHGYAGSYNVKNIQGLSGVNVQNDRVTFTPDFIGGSLTIEYIEDVNNPDIFAQLSFRQGSNGSVGGDSSSKTLRKGTYRIEENGDIETLTGIVGTPAPDPCYKFDGWYEVDSSGAKISSRLTEIVLDGNKTIKAFFEEDPDMWYDITFEEGNHVRFSTVTRTFHVKQGTLWNEIVPGLSFDNGYELDYWYDSYGRTVSIGLNPAFTQSETFKVKAKSTNPIPNENSLNTPNAIGAIGDNGGGEIKVNDTDPSRRYAVTDLTGEILEIIQGQDVKFTDLNPGAYYHVYELPTGSAAQSGENITQIPDQEKSDPAFVRIPSLGNNWEVEPDENNTGRAVIVIEPAAPNTEYALLDENGNVVHDWKVPSGLPLRVEFDDLDPNKDYRVVTREVGGSEIPQDNSDKGTDIRTDLDASSYTSYKLTINNGEIISVDGEEVGASVQEGIEAGTRVKIKADNLTPSMDFKKWKIEGGEIPGFSLGTADEIYFRMPERNLVLTAVYEDSALPATPSNVIVEYQVNDGHAGEVSLNANSVELVDLAERFCTYEDQDLLDLGKEVKYIIDFNKRAVTQNEANAVRAQYSYTNAFKLAWALDVKTLRKVDNVRINGNVSNSVDFNVEVQMNINHLGQIDYQLWEVYEDSQGMHMTQIPMNPDPDQDPVNTRYFTFNAEPDKSYILSYSKVNKVTIVDKLRNNLIETINLRQGDVLSGWNPPADYTDANGLVWTYKGLSTNELVYQGYEFDLSTAILQDTVLYIHYESSDPAWENARNELENKIREAEDLINGGTLTPQKENDLQTAIDHARDLLNRNPIPSTNELIQEKNDLQKAIDKAKATDPDPGPGPGPSPGGNGGGGSTTTNTKKYLTAGVDGDWKLIDPTNHQWIFELRSGSRVTGKWAEISYTHNGTARTHWYHFNSDGVMDSGWFLDGGTWYYLSTTHDGWFGNMLTGWQYSSQEGKWYYLDPASGAMAVGWREINGKWYYFTESNQRNTYSYDPLKKQWVYLNVSERPLGSMYAGERTPDGYQVNADGAWTDVK